MAPEQVDADKGHGFEVDIWAIGVIIFTLLTGKPPFETESL
jgi:polo-like kinase 1